MEKVINGFKDYTITKDGVVRSIKSGKVIKPHNKKGYIACTLKSKGKWTTATVHNLIARTYIPNPNGFNCVKHKNGNTTDNRIDNLEWAKRNLQGGESAKTCQIIKDGEIRIYQSIKEAATANGVSGTTVQRMLKGDKTKNKWEVKLL